MADLIIYNFTYQSKDPYFRGISAATRGGSNNNLGSGKTETSYGYGLTFNFHKLLPKVWGARIPIRYNYTRRTLIPLLRNGTDIVLPDNIREQEKNDLESVSLGVNGISFNHKGNNLLFKLFLNRLTSTSFSYGRTKQYSVTTPFRYGENFSFRSGIRLGMQKPPSIPIFAWTKSIPLLKKMSASRLFLYPNQWNISGDYSRNLSIVDDISFNRSSNISRSLNGNVELSFKIFENLSANLRYRTSRDLSDLNLVRWSVNDPKIGQETRYVHNFSGNYDPKLFKFVTTSINYRADYSENYDKSFESFRSVLSRSWGVSGSFDHKKLLSGGTVSSARRRFKGGKSNREKAEENLKKGKEKEKKKSGKSFLSKPVSILKKLTNWINPFTYKYNRGFNNSIPGIIKRPGWRYQFGLILEPDIGSLGKTNRQPSANETETYSVSSGFVLFGGVRTDISYRKNISQDLISQGDKYKLVNTSWPELNIRISKFKSLPLIRKYVNKFIGVFSPRTGYTRSNRSKFIVNYNQSGKDFESERVTSVSHNPLISINLKLWRSLSLSSSYVLSKNKRINNNITTGEFQSETNSTRRTIALTTKYSFSSPNGFKLPFFGRIKFRSTMSVELNVKFNSDLSVVNLINNPPSTKIDRSDISIAPRISYQFSRQIKGGITGRWQDSVDNGGGGANRKNHIRELQIWTEIRF